MPMMRLSIYSFFLFSLFLSPFLYAQEEEDQSLQADQQGFFPLLDLEAEVPEPLPIKKKFVPKSVYYGIKGKRVRVRSFQHLQPILEQAYYIKNLEERPPPYVQAIFWYDKKERRFRKTRTFSSQKGYLLHGRYEKKMDKQVLQVGYFYKGTLHGRWLRWSRKNLLLSKENYRKGWAAEAQITFYDPQRKLLREVIPVQHGEKEGEYFAFYPSGNLAVRGQYRHDKRVGKWESYHPILLGGKRRLVERIIQYPETAFEDEISPYIVREWSQDGTLLYAKKDYLQSVQ
ncbi:MAG: hypothetical protein OXB93_02300 [Cytophagales bacterium]|nr:hypothetical protein [Cytophagales bacterium]